MALGAQVVTSTVEGRERYGVSIRYPRALRSEPESIARDIEIALPGGGAIPLGEVASVELARGATSIRTENGRLAAYIFVDIAGRDLGGYVAEAQAAVAKAVDLPDGYSVGWSGQFEYLERAVERLKVVVPLTLALIFLLTLPELPPSDRDSDRHAVFAVRARRRHLADVVARVQYVCGRRRRFHRACRRCRGDRGHHAHLSRSRTH